MKKAIVIGSGIAGLASALRLRKKGYEVDVFESSSKIGGKLDVIEKDGFRWDAGPSLFTMPHFVDELFSLFNENPRDHFNYLKKDVICNYFWEDGTEFSAKSNSELFQKELSEKFGEDKKDVSNYLESNRKKYELTSPVFLDQSLHKWQNYLHNKTLKAFLNSSSFDLFSTLNEVNKKRFKNPKTVQLFNRFATYNGSSPYKTPGIMSMIPSLEMDYGTYFPEKGMRSIVDSIYSLGLRHGVNYHLNEKVNNISEVNNRVKGIQTDKAFYDADVVVSNMDIYYTYKELLKNHVQPKKSLAQEKSSSALIFYWGIGKEFPQLDLHNIFFSKDYQKEFEYLFDKKDLADDLTVYVHISSKDKKDDAPRHMENWFVMINAPANYGQNWEKLKAKAKEIILKKLTHCLKTNIEELIEAEEVLDPILIDAKTNSHRGSLYGTSSNSRYAAFLRHPNFNKISNLYFCGGSVHPGGGIPLCLKSAKIVSDLVLKPA